jgi:hypothetical protein
LQNHTGRAEILGELFMNTKEALEAWDRGDPIETISMGGMGDYYERGIHTCVFELIRDCSHFDFPNDDDQDEWKQIAQKIDDAAFKNTTIEHLGLSGAMYYAARNVAVRAITMGWDEMYKSIPKERKVIVQKVTP